MSKIKDVIVEYYRIPLPELVSDAKHGVHTHFEVPIVKIQTEEGIEGVGYTYTGVFGGRSISKLIEVELRNVLLGKDADRTGMAIAAGENLRTPKEFEHIN